MKFFSCNARGRAKGNSRHSDKKISLFLSGRTKGLSAPLYTKCIEFITKRHIALLVSVVIFFTTHALPQFNSYNLRVTESVWNSSWTEDLSNIWSHLAERDMRWRSWLRHCATSRKVAGSIPDSVIGILHWHNPSGRTYDPGVDADSNINE